MANPALDRVHERLDDNNLILAEIRADVAEIRADLKVNTALCGECRPKVMGNGQDSLDNRVTRLEEARAVSKVFLLGMFSAAGAVGSLATIMLKLLGI
jgi:hypothetical protein